MTESPTPPRRPVHAAPYTATPRASVPARLTRRLAALLAIAMLTVAVPAPNAVAAQSPKPRPYPRGTVEWTRLITPSSSWNRHSRNDGQLLDYIAANTRYRVAQHKSATAPEDLAELSRYPFVFAHDIGMLNGAGARNLAEYMKRGGFVFLDYCANPTVNPNPSKFIEAQKRTLLRYLPELTITPLPPEHQVFRELFIMKKFPPQADGGWLKGAHRQSRCSACISATAWWA